ncbi:hypothetical protein FKA81_23995 [Salmonella enterica subsp. enterica serovar Typhimurium]|nr:hypothetical protein FKA81_23995 [Salmonella enterica subsp. enterica serovar Typhimurium]
MYVPPESPSAENRPQCGGRQAETAAPSGAVALHTVRCAGSAVSGATGAARPERSLQAGFSRIGP